MPRQQLPRWRLLDGGLELREPGGRRWRRHVVEMSIAEVDRHLLDGTPVVLLHRGAQAERLDGPDAVAWWRELRPLVPGGERFSHRNEDAFWGLISLHRSEGEGRYLILVQEG